MKVGRRFRGTRDGGDLAELHEEIGRLKHENMTLRLDRQRPTTLGRVSEQVHALASDVSSRAAETTAADKADDARHLLAQSRALRSALLDVLQTLQIAAAQMERQLTGDVPTSEADRRVLDRRRTHHDAATETPENGDKHRDSRGPVPLQRQP